MLGGDPDTSIPELRVARALTALIARRGKPRLIVSDNDNVHLQRDTDLVGGPPDRLALHPDGQADAELFV
jgi:hypothetical protein